MSTISCQICGHQEDGLTCPKCKRHTCNSCFKAFKDQGFKTQECNYCGYRWFEPKVKVKKRSRKEKTPQIKYSGWSSKVGWAEEDEFGEDFGRTELNIKISPTMDTDFDNSHTMTVHLKDSNGDPISFNRASVYINGDLIHDQYGIEGAITFNTDVLSNGWNELRIVSDGKTIIKNFEVRLGRSQKPDKPKPRPKIV